MTAVRDTVALVFGLDRSGVTGDTSPANIPAWDSVRFIELILALEDRLGFQFTYDEISTISDVASIETIVARRSGS